MSREWKPGEVAMLTISQSSDGRARGRGPTVAVRDNVGSWACGAAAGRLVEDHDVLTATPLVVIDPEDREAVERLMEQYRSVPGWYAGNRNQTVDCMQAALRIFANPAPPKPDEPTGLGAVVEDEDGKRYVRTADTDCRMPWSYANNYTDFEWAQVHAVRVLSEGV